MRFSRRLAVLALALALGGCSSDFRFILYSSQKQVYEPMSYDQSFHNHLAKLSKGPTVEGSACMFALPATLDRVRQNSFNAYQDAIKKAGYSYDALINATQTITHYPWDFLLFRYCVKIKGTAVKYDEYNPDVNRTS
jgi:hypothetical protein